MSFRGRGRGGRYGGGGYRHVIKSPFELFPKIEELPDVKNVKEELALVVWSTKLQKSWNLSPYYYEGVGKVAKGNASIDIEKYSDKDSEKTKHKAPLSHFIRMTDEYVPAELAEKQQRGRKRVRWNPESDIQRLDLFEKLEQKSQGQDGKGEKEKKEGEGEEDDERIEEEEEEFSDDGDYNQNIDFDDDDDDFNMGDDNDDEAVY